MSGESSSIPSGRIANGKGVADLLGISHPTLANWRRRYSSFPKPLDAPNVVGIPLWDVEEILIWCQERERAKMKLSDGEADYE